MASRARINKPKMNRFLYQGTGKVQPVLQRIGRDIERVAEEKAPKDTGRLANSISSVHIGTHATNNAGVRIQVRAPYAKDVEFGTGPQHIHASKPPYLPKLRRSGLIKWSESKRLNPYAVQKGIAVHGTPAQPFLVPAIEQILRRYNFRWIR